MLTLVYREDGKAVSDFEAEELILKWVEEAEKSGRYAVFISTENVFVAARALVVRKGIKLRFRYEDQIIEVGKDGRTRGDWPVGFCDKVDGWLTEILNAPVDDEK